MGERGFTVMEVLVALTVLLIGIGGILSLQISSLRASGYSRHAAEAAVVGEDRIELLRLAPAASLASGSDVVNELGVADPEGRYTREWTVARNGKLATIEVEVSWLERGSDSHAITMRTQREVP
jgi:prepilin-type N-terminal cleavage/methylation domain-containing protein